MRYENEDEFMGYLDVSLEAMGVPNTVPEACVCADRAGLAAWFVQFARAARAARLRSTS